MRNINREELRKVNRAECELLNQRRQSDEFANAVMKFISSKSKI